jgi:hypothetical protein
MTRRSTAPALPKHRLRLVSDDMPPGPRKPGSRRPHRNATVARVKKLIETTPMTYAEISEATGVGRATICRWTRDAGWRRHLNAPRATDTVPSERAGARLKLRTLACRLAYIAEAYVWALEQNPYVDVEMLSEAFGLYQLAEFASRVRKPRGAVRYAEPFGYPSPMASLYAELRRNGIDPMRPPEKAVLDYAKSRLYEDPKWRPKNKTKRQRHTEWMLEKI